MDKELLRAEYEKACKNDKRMVDYCMKQTDVVVELENGGYLVLYKPCIKTIFCFGYGVNGRTYEGDMEDAWEEERAIHEADNFKDKNLSGIDEQLRLMRSIERRLYSDEWWKEHPWWLKGSVKGIVIYTARDGCNIYDYQFGYDDDIQRIEKVTETYIPTQKDIEAIISGLEEQRAKFEKRLDTYLKRYGTSKLKTWIFLRD